MDFLLQRSGEPTRLSITGVKWERGIVVILGMEHGLCDHGCVEFLEDENAVPAFCDVTIMDEKLESHKAASWPTKGTQSATNGPLVAVTFDRRRTGP